MVLEPLTANKKDATIVKGGDQWTIPQARVTVAPNDHVRQDQDEGSVEVVARKEMKPRCSPLPPEEEREYWQLSDEELNRKVEEFITRFNRDMIQQEAAVSSTIRMKESVDIAT